MLIFSFFACGEVESKDIPTAEITANLSAIAYSETVKINASLRYGDGSFADGVILSEGDILEAGDGTTFQHLTRNEKLGRDNYSTEFPAVDEETEFLVRFNRAEFNDATENCATVPHPFELTFPYDYAHFRRTDQITVTWGASCF